MSKHKLFLIAVFLLGSMGLEAQDFAMQNGTINRCSGEFTDDGTGGPYTDTGYTLTICPDAPGNVVRLTFSAFSLQTSAGSGNSDYLIFYDGDNTNANSLGSYTGNISNLTVTASIYNPTGCLTVVFDPNGAPNTTFPGWSAEVDCTIPCAAPTMQSAITNPLPVGTEQSVGVCIGEMVTFSGQGSQAEPGFNLVDYIWDFADGTTANGLTVSHSFDEPGEYIVNLTVVDNNGCTNTNVIPLQVLVSTIPIFAGIQQIETEYCFGADIVLDAGEIISTTWTALPPQVVSGTTYLADGAGFSYNSPITFDIFEPGQTLENCSDLYSVFVNMEHSYMGDLGLTITCPDGTIVNLLTYPSGGGGTFLGEPVDDNTIDNLMPGTGYDYYWSPTATNGTWGENTNGLPQVNYTNNLGQNVTAYGGILPSGTYEAAGNMCDLVGCPLNGSWTFSVYDNLGADNGYIFSWGLNLNPALFPDVTTFTPIYGQGADSTWWEGPYIGMLSDDADVATLDLPGPGSYDYTYYATNNFGCTFDTTITITVTQAMAVTAGPDLLYACGDVQLQGSFVGMPPPLCSNDAGDYTYCYDNNQTQYFTYCPNNPGDGTTMTISFTAGSVENGFDEFWVFDGPDQNAPLLDGPIYGSLAGLSFTATNPNGCITIGVTPDGSVSCGSGSQAQWQYNVGCTTGGPDYTWHWTPDTNLDDNDVQNPVVSNLSQTTTYTLTGYPVGFPGCATTDEVTVTVDPLANPGTDTQISVCNTDAPFLMTDMLNGNPVSYGTWYDAFGTEVAGGMFDPAVNMAGNYQYVVSAGNCDMSAVLTIEMASPTMITLAADTIICHAGTANLNLVSQFFGKAPFQYTWTYDGQTIGTTDDMTYQPTASGEACLTVTDACQFTIQDCMSVTVLPSIDVAFTADTTGSCWPAPFVLTCTNDPSHYTQSHWQISDGSEYFNTATVNHTFESPGTYSVELILTNSKGCSYSASAANYLSSYPPPVANFDYSPKPTDASETEITFENLSSGQIQNYAWSFGQSPVLGYSTLVNPVYEFPLGIGGEYPVELTVRTIHNCTDKHSGVVIINDIFQIFVPNSFTPNGDGINDEFFIIGTDIDESRYHFQIFDRWGSIVFDSHDRSEPWLGDVNRGEYFAPNGVYTWRSVFISKTKGERKEMSGSVLLFR